MSSLQVFCYSAMGTVQYTATHIHADDQRHSYTKLGSGLVVPRAGMPATTADVLLALGRTMESLALEWAKSPLYLPEF